MVKIPRKIVHVYEKGKKKEAKETGGETPEQKKKIEHTMREFKGGTLKSSSGEVVTDRDRAIAIAMSKAGLSKKSAKKRKK